MCISHRQICFVVCSSALTSSSLKISIITIILIWLIEWKESGTRSILLLTIHTVVSVTQVNTTVSQGHTLSADDVSVTVKLKFYARMDEQVQSTYVNDGLPVAFDEQLQSRTAINRELKHSSNVLKHSSDVLTQLESDAYYIAIDTVLHCWLV